MSCFFCLGFSLVSLKKATLVCYNLSLTREQKRKEKKRKMATTGNDNDKDMITVTIKQLDGQSFNVTCSRDATVLGLKTLVMEERNLTIDRQRLIYRAQELVDSDKLLSEYGVNNGSVLHIVIRPIGGNAAPAAPQVAVDMPPQLSKFYLLFLFLYFYYLSCLFLIVSLCFVFCIFCLFLKRKEFIFGQEYV